LIVAAGNSTKRIDITRANTQKQVIHHAYHKLRGLEIQAPSFFLWIPAFAGMTLLLAGFIELGNQARFAAGSVIGMQNTLVGGFIQRAAGGDDGGLRLVQLAGGNEIFRFGNDGFHLGARRFIPRGAALIGANLSDR